MNIQFITGTEDVRGVQSGWLLNDSPPVLLDGPLVIPANEVVTFNQAVTINSDISLISICPHMHLLGRSYEVWGETPNGEIIPLISIPNWGFSLAKILHLPANSKKYHQELFCMEKVFMIIRYTITTILFDPPQTAYSGITTIDEMFLCYFIYAPYQEGDEHVVLDSTILDISHSC